MLTRSLATGRLGGYTIKLVVLKMQAVELEEEEVEEEEVMLMIGLIITSVVVTMVAAEGGAEKISTTRGVTMLTRDIIISRDTATNTTTSSSNLPDGRCTQSSSETLSSECRSSRLRIE